MSPFERIVSLALLAAVATGCSKDANAPDANTPLTGHWIASDTVEVFTGFDVHLVQSGNGSLTGDWVGKTRITNGKCDVTFGCAPSNIVFGSNLNLRVDLEILGAGSFTGQLATKELLEGQIIRLGTVYKLRLHKAN
jgi:hypothetical protein